MKKQFSIPQAIPVADSPMATPWYGSGSGEGNSIKPVPMSFSEWSQSRFVADYDQNPGVDFQDYAAWFNQCGFGETAWMQLNPGASMDVTETK